MVNSKRIGHLFVLIKMRFSLKYENENIIMNATKTITITIRLEAYI